MSSTGAVLFIAVPSAMAGAAGYGLATAVQARATHEVPVEPTLHPRLLVDLIRRPLWLIGLLATIVALGLQIVALAFGPIALVQPLLVTSVLFAATFAAWLSHRRLDPVIAIGGLLCAVGLSTFLLLARPSESSSTLLVGEVLPLGAVLGGLVAGSLFVAGRSRSGLHVIALALATGILYGTTAGLMKIVSMQFRNGLDEPFRHWTLYTVCVVGPMGFLLSQNTFQQGRLISPAMAVITSVDPLVGVAIGVSWLGEGIEFGAAQLVGEALAAVVIIGGIALICWRGTHLVQASARSGRAAVAVEQTWA